MHVRSPFAAARPGPKEVARGKRLVVTTHHPVSAHAGLQVLRAGGTAADALVAVTALDTVVLPGTSTLGGQLTVVLHEAGTGATHALNAGFNAVLDDDTPFDYLRERTTGRAIFVPGTIAGLEAIWRRFGALPWADLWRPAAHFARDGFPLYPAFHQNMRRREEALLRHPEGRATFAPRGRLLRPGDTLRQPALAETLQRVAAEGAAFAYQGGWAQQLVAAVRGIGGKMRLEDLARYQPYWEVPLNGTYLGHKVRTLPPPAAGGSRLVVGLSVAEALDLHHRPPRERSGRTLFEEIQIDNHTERSSRALSCDPRVASPEEMAMIRRVLSKEHAGETAASIGAIGTGTATAATAPLFGTQCVGIVDARGNTLAAVHTITSLSWGDTGLFVGGVCLNSAAHQYGLRRPSGGGRLVTHAVPYVVLRDGQPVFAAAASGAGAIGCNLQKTIDVVGRGLALGDSVAAPRWGFRRVDYATMTHSEGRVVDRFAPAVLNDVERAGQPLVREFPWRRRRASRVQRLRALVYRIVARAQGRRDNPLPSYNFDTGQWCAVGVDAATGAKIGVADPRLGGRAIAE
jgi:gamma-glutamyltranspeptidase/glutathione hydrolase